MSNDFYDQMAMKWISNEPVIPLEFKPPTPETHMIKEAAHKKLKYPEGSNQAEMYEYTPLTPTITKQLHDSMNTRIDHINPSHYKGIVGGYQYIETMEFILGKEGLRAHLIGQGYKYLMRMGKKDAEQQELKKAIWYFRCLDILLREGTIIGKLKELE